MSIAFISHPSCLKHEMGPYHPESPARLSAIETELKSSGLFQQLQHYTAPAATKAQLARVHSQRYLGEIADLAPFAGHSYLDPDTAMNPHTQEAALHAAGAVVLATDLVLRGEVQSAFCSVRPPGHHATHNHAMGFCIYNNVAVGVAHALAEHGITRIAIADFDVHHGNGTEDIFQNEPRVMLCSTFQHPYYPYCGAESGNEHIINVPLPAGTGSQAFRDAVTRTWLPALTNFKPQLLYISAGFDAHKEDTLASFTLDESDYFWVTQQLKIVAEEYAQGRVISALEGGYNLSALARSVAAHLRALLGFDQA